MPYLQSQHLSQNLVLGRSRQQLLIVLDHRRPLVGGGGLRLACRWKGQTAASDGTNGMAQFRGRMLRQQRMEAAALRLSAPCNSSCKLRAS